MPNNIANKLVASAETQAEIESFLSAIAGVERDETLDIDFERILPMPECLSNTKCDGKKNNREYLIVGTPEESYSFPSFTFPEYMMSVVTQGINSTYFPNDEIRDEMLSAYDSLDVDYDEDLLLDEDREPVFAYDYDPDDHEDEEDFEEEEYIAFYEVTQYRLIGVRMESDNLLFCVQEVFTDDEQTSCETVNEVSADEISDSALEVCVRILSDETKDSIFWKI